MQMWLKAVLIAISATMSYADTGTTCDVTRDPDVKYFDIRLPEMRVTENRTTYVCQKQMIPLPMNVAYHAVAFEPIIMNKDIMHHMILFGCDKAVSDEPHDCSGADGVCKSFLVQWSMGIEGKICSYNDTGARFGLGSFQALALQIHWNNAKMAKGMSDSSGFRVYYTTHLRRYDLGNVQVGQNDLQIPPGVTHFPQTGSCSSDCTQKLMNEPIYLTRAHIHLHYVGDGGILELIRNGRRVQTIVNDTEFDYTDPPYHVFDDPVQVLPGDELRLTCYYNTRDGKKYRNTTLYWDMASDGEMCYAFITYFPLQHSLSQCIQFAEYDVCAPVTSAIGGCAFEGFIGSFKTFLAQDIMSHCSSTRLDVHISTSQGYDVVAVDKEHLCSDECDMAMKAMTEHPCMQNRLGHHTRRVYLSTIDSWENVKILLESASQFCSD